jgi:hypothetical protein
MKTRHGAVLAHIRVMRIHQSRAALVAALPMLLLVACHRGRAPAGPPPPEQAPAARESEFLTGQGVVEAMHARYLGKWYTTMTFKQKTSRLVEKTGKWNVQTWYEAMKLPGRLRIDFEPVSAGNGVLYARDSQFVVQNGRLLSSGPGINPLLLLGFDVYTATVAHTTTRLRREGFDMEKVHETTFQGKPMIVVGAEKGDYNRKQFWIDKEKLLFVRMLEPTPRDTSKMQDIRFTNYEPRGAAWVAPRVEIWSDGKLVFYEDYDDIKVNVDLDDVLFQPKQWRAAKHWTKTP